jgi:hypothetical protein
MKPLPGFKTRRPEEVEVYTTQMLTHSDEPERSYFQRLETFDDGHYRAIFSLEYFRKTDEPTKSQWNSLKKKMKRHDKQVFIFKEHGLFTGENAGYIDFGFFAHTR